MTASAEIVTEVRDDAISVPIQCVSVRTPDQLGSAPGVPDERPRFTPDRDGYVEIVWVVEEGMAAARQVEAGIQGESFIEITDGILVGEDVVIGSYRAISRDLTDGAPVLIAGVEDRS